VILKIGVIKMTKDEYKTCLNSEHWKKLAEKTKTLRPYCEGETCPLDGIGRDESRERFRVDLEVHHLNYNNLHCEQEDDLQVLCFKCHEQESGIFRDSCFFNEDDGTIEAV
jgi:hypothetical protein